MATKNKEVLDMIKSVIANDYTVSDVSEYKRKYGDKTISEDLMLMYMQIAERYNIVDRDGMWNWVKVMKVIEFHNQVVGTILVTEGWWLPIQTPFGKFDIRPEKLLFTIKSMSNSSVYKNEAKRVRVNNLIEWYNSYVGYRQSKIRLKKNFQRFHHELSCIPETEILGIDIDRHKKEYQRRAEKRTATLYSYIGDKCMYGKRVGVITDIVKPIPVIYRVKFEDSPIEEAIKSKDLVIEKRLIKEIAKMKHEAKRASLLRDNYNDKIKSR